MTRIALIPAIMLAAAVAGAQTARVPSSAGATISGVVRDSISGRPLAGATIQLVARDQPASIIHTATSDSLGRFLLNDVPLGTYRIGFLHSMLDSLGVEAPLREVHVDSYSPVIADLAVPSAARFRGAVCGNNSTGDSSGVIIGTVYDARDGSPAPNVSVQGEWLEFSLNRLGMARQIGRRTATTTGAGWFALCDVPATGTVVLVAARGGDSTGTVEVEMPPGGFMRRALYLGSARTDSVSVATRSGNATDTVRRRIHVGSGKLAGKVVSVATGQPLAGAVVAITDGPQARTNDRGEWIISNAPTGTRMIEVRALGYYPVQRQVDVVSGAPPVDVALSTFKAVLDTVRIIASRNPFGPDAGGFQRRRKMGLGNFITPADIIRFPVTVTSDIFRRVPSVRFEPGEHGDRYLTIRGCRPAIFVNGANMSFMDATDIDTYVPPKEIAGIEVYSETTAPGEFSVGLGGCGSIVIWTK